MPVMSHALHFLILTVAGWLPWMKQQARNLTDVFDGFLRGKWKLIHDRDPLFSADSLRRSAQT
jgi:hypothetical protein